MQLYSSLTAGKENHVTTGEIVSTLASGGDYCLTESGEYDISFSGFEIWAWCANYEDAAECAGWNDLVGYADLAFSFNEEELSPIALTKLESWPRLNLLTNLFHLVHSKKLCLKLGSAFTTEIVLPPKDPTVEFPPWVFQSNFEHIERVEDVVLIFENTLNYQYEHKPEYCWLKNGRVSEEVRKKIIYLLSQSSHESDVLLQDKYMVRISSDDNDISIVESFSRYFDGNELIASKTDSGLSIIFSGNKLEIPLTQQSYVDRYLTIVGVSNSIGPKYQIRADVSCLGERHHKFLIGDEETWSELEREYPEVIAKRFVTMVNYPGFFGSKGRLHKFWWQFWKRDYLAGLS